MPVITISKEYGAESEILAKKVADILDYAILDKQLMADISSRFEPLPIEEELDADGQTRLNRLIHESIPKTIRDIVQRRYGRLDNDAYFEITVELVKKAARNDKVLILGLGAQCILAEHPHCLHIRVVKQLEERIAWLRQHFGFDQRTAKEFIEREEKESSSYIEHYFNRSWNDPHLYHMVLNLSKLTIDEAVHFILTWVRRHSE